MALALLFFFLFSIIIFHVVGWDCKSDGGFKRGYWSVGLEDGGLLKLVAFSVYIVVVFCDVAFFPF